MNLLSKLRVHIPLWQKSIPRYPLYIKGNPQLRVHLPLFWVKLIKWPKALPPDTQAFMVHHQMTEHDVENYLKKIYSLNVLTVRITLKRGVERHNSTFGFPMNHGPDRRYAFVQMEDIEDFKFPDIWKSKANSEEQMEPSQAPPPPLTTNPLKTPLNPWLQG